MDLRISFKVFRRLSRCQQDCIFGLRHFIVCSRGLPVKLREYLQCCPSSHTRNCNLRFCQRRNRRTTCCAKSLPPAAVRRQPASCWRAKDEPSQTRQGVFCVVGMRQISTNLTATCRACSWAGLESMLSVHNSHTIFTTNTSANYAHENGAHLVRPDPSSGSANRTRQRSGLEHDNSRRRRGPRGRSRRKTPGSSAYAA
jgi:hypothetical protein